MKLRATAFFVLALALARPLFAQGYGTNSYNTGAPASGGMAGVSLARPQDAPSAIFGNPATLTQFEGTRFTFGGSFADSTYTVNHDGFISGGVPFSATSGTQGFGGGSIGLITDLGPLGLPAVVGMGFGGLSGLGAEFRGLAPVGGNITNEYVVLGNSLSVGVDVTDRLSLGATMLVGTAFAQFGLTQTSAMVHDYALAGSVGGTFELTPSTMLSTYYQSEMQFSFDNMFLLPSGAYQSFRLSQPETVGFGVSQEFADGRLLLATDVLFIEWGRARMYEDVWKNQWAFAFGAQYTTPMGKPRIGYSYNTNPINQTVGANLSGFPIGQAAVEYYLASSLAAITQHRFTMGFGKENVLYQGMDMDLFAGGLFRSSEQFGDHSSTAVIAWYAGFGITWRFNPRPAGG